MNVMGAFRARMTGVVPPIIHQLNTQLRNEVDLKKKRLRAVTKALVFCAKAGIALRGHRNESLPLTETEDDTWTIKGDINRGNFMPILAFMRQSGDKDVDVFINKKASYTSHAIQDELLVKVGSHVTEQIVQQVITSKYYSIIADETRDSSNVEVLCVAVRFFNSATRQPDEKFLRFLPLQSLKGIACYIIKRKLCVLLIH